MYICTAARQQSAAETVWNKITFLTVSGAMIKWRVHAEVTIYSLKSLVLPFTPSSCCEWTTVTPFSPGYLSTQLMSYNICWMWRLDT